MNATASKVHLDVGRQGRSQLPGVGVEVDPEVRSDGDVAVAGETVSSGEEGCPDGPDAGNLRGRIVQVGLRWLEQVAELWGCNGDKTRVLGDAFKTHCTR